MENYNLNNTNYSQAYENAVKRVKKIKGFYIHLFVYIVINTANILFGISKLKDGQSYFETHNFSTAFFWGIGLLLHGISVYSPHSLFGKKWEEQKIKEFMEKDKNSKWE